MTEVDAAIPLQTRGVQLDNPMDVQAKALQLKNLGIQTQQAQQDYDDSQTLRALYQKNSAGGTLDQAGLLHDAYASGLGTKALAIQQQYLANQKTGSDITKNNADAAQANASAQTSQFELHQKNLAHVGQTLNTLLQGSVDATTGQRIPASSQDVIDAVHNEVDGGYISAADGAQVVRNIPSNPAAIPGFLQNAVTKTQSVQQQLEAAKARAPELKNTGNALTAVDPLTGKPTGAAPIPLTASPDTLATNAKDVQVANAKLQLQQSKGFAPDEGELLGALAAHGVNLPAGLRSQAQMKATIRNLIDSNPGKSPDEIAELVGNGQINFNSDKKAATVAAGQEGKVETAVNELSTFGDQALDASAKVPRRSFVPVNQLMQMADSSISDPNLLTLKLKLNALNNAYNVLSARGGTDAASRAHVAQLFSAANSPEGVQALVTGLKQEAAGAKGAAAQASHVGPPAAGPAGAAPPGARPPLDSIFGGQ